VGFATIFYCFGFETSLLVASYDSQGHGGGIRARLHKGYLSSDFSLTSSYICLGFYLPLRLVSLEPCRDHRLQWFLLRVALFRCCVNNVYLSVATETFLYMLPRTRCGSLCNTLLIQSYSLLRKRVPTIRRPAVAPSVLPRERVERRPLHQMGRLQLSCVMPQYICNTLNIIAEP
jgi:hypothetical protein